MPSIRRFNPATDLKRPAPSTTVAPTPSPAPKKPRSTPRMQRKLKEATPQHEFTKDERGPRLQKVLAEAGVDSRRACEELIEEGRVRVNGHLVSTLPAWVDPAKDHITVDGRHIKTREPHVYVMLFKPRGVVTTADDPEGRPRVVDFVQHHSKARLYPVGRLEMDASGLLLLTNDGELANRLTHPKHEVHQTYEVVVGGALEENAVRKLEAGLFRKEKAPAKVEGKSEPKSDPKGVRPATSRLKLKKRDRDRTLLTLELKEGRNRQIRLLMARLGHNVKKLRRVGIGPLKLRGLQTGQWRELTSAELSALKRAAGMD
jgi:pseudouridine synthase